MSIKVSSVDKYFGRQKALDGVSFTIPAGQVVGFLGPNGAGKSTMMKIITGYLPPSSGSVEVCDLNVEGHQMDVRRRLGYLPENNPLYPDMYVPEYLLFVASLYKLANRRERVEQMIELTGLVPERHKIIGALSKGYRQRVGLAQALLPNPEVLVLDEPTTGLDPNQIVEVRQLISDIGKEKTVLLSTHIMQEVRAICERVIVINRGKVVADGNLNEMEWEGADPGQRVFVEYDRPVAPEKIYAIPGVSKVKACENGWQITSGEAVDVRPALFRLAVENNLVVLTMTREQTSLEELFGRLTQ